MKVIRAQVSGFCMGVRRAVTMATEAASTYKNVYTIGPLIHNPRVLDDLEKLGISILKKEDMPAVKNAVIIIRAHGISPWIETELARNGNKLIDATCPRVKTSQKTALAFAEQLYIIFLAGEKDHAEIEGIQAYVQPCCLVVSSPAEAKAAAKRFVKSPRPPKNAVLIGQTTISPEEYSAIGKAIKKYLPQLEIIDTICSATEDRQKALRELCAQTQAIIIIGGRQSANTQRLYSLACGMGKPCWLVESVDEIPREISQYETVGLASGASTPDSLINEIEERLKGIDESINK